MSTYGDQPQNPNPYGEQPTNPYGDQPAYGGRPQPMGTYAAWGKRVGASLLDALLTALAALPLFIGYGILIASATTTTAPDGTVSIQTSGGGLSIGLILLGLLTYAAFYIWNVFIRQGRTGQTIGKGVLNIRLIKEETAQPIGAGMAFVRQIAHVLDGFCMIGYLWPLWDAKNQTFADKILTTIVVDAPKG